MRAGDVMRHCMIELDVPLARRCWSQIAPNMPQPADEFETLVTLHHARTQAESVPFNLRAYSHDWLCDRGLPSMLPDRLRPRAQRMYPREVEAVGVAVKTMSAASIPLAKAIEQAMSVAVAECYADGRTTPKFVRARMEEARRKMMA